jgi:hypothetical protein
MVRVVPSVSISCNVLLVVDCDRSAPAKVCLIAIALVSGIVVHSQISYHHVEVGPSDLGWIPDSYGLGPKLKAEYMVQTLLRDDPGRTSCFPRIPQVVVLTS